MSCLVDLVRFELTTSSMPWKRAPNCATGPWGGLLLTLYHGSSLWVSRPRFRYHKFAMNRDQAWELLCEFTKTDSLRRHAMAVETCVAAYARKFGEDETKWSVTALLHDFDWEIHPQLPDHPVKGEPILAERGVHEEIRRAILSHADFTGVPRDTPLEKTLFACDELAGFLTACSYVKPNKSIHEVDVPSVRRKLKDKAFARSVSRDDIVNGAAGLGVELDQHIAFCIEAMQERAPELGLSGAQPAVSAGS
jgi:putative nucleotidyltransferase with HDIG domain